MASNGSKTRKENHQDGQRSQSSPSRARFEASPQTTIEQVSLTWGYYLDRHVKIPVGRFEEFMDPFNEEFSIIDSKLCGFRTQYFIPSFQLIVPSQDDQVILVLDWCATFYEESFLAEL